MLVFKKKLYLVIGKSLLYVVHFSPNLVSLGFTWIHLRSLRLFLIALALNGTLWFTWVHLDLCSLWVIFAFGFTSIHFDSLGFTWVHLSSFGLTRVHLGLIGITWVTFGLNGFTWVHLGLLGLTWVHLDFCEFTWIHLDSLGIKGGYKVTRLKKSRTRTDRHRIHKNNLIKFDSTNTTLRLRL